MCRRGDIYRVDFDVENNNIQCGKRPVLVISNEKNNKFASTVTVVKLTSQIKRLDLPTHVKVIGYGLPKPSMVLAEQITTIEKSLLTEDSYIGHIDDKEKLQQIVDAVMVQISSLC